MDGVVVDLVPALFKICGWDPNTKANGYHLEKIMGLTTKEFWAKIETGGADFWRNAEELPWFRELYRELSGLGKVIFCTSPTLDSNCIKGKLQWLQDRLGHDFRNYVITPHKELLAGKGILIDDNEKFINKFNDAGGQAILFPAACNPRSDWLSSGVSPVSRIVEEVKVSLAKEPVNVSG